MMNGKMLKKNDNNFMPVEEMRKYRWSINWSGGKDSTATIIACIKYNVPIEVINYVRMMYDDDLPATLPIMTNFVDRCIDRLVNQYKIKVNVIKSETCKKNVCDKVYKRSKYEDMNGTRYTLAKLLRGRCKFQDYKGKALDKIKQTEHTMIGYCIDEKERYHRLKHPYQESILCTLGIDQSKAIHICKVNNMLSPLYDLGISRDGCFFCPNCKRKEIDYIKENYPELVEIIYKEFMQKDDKYLYANLNSWIKEYKKDMGII